MVDAEGPRRNVADKQGQSQRKNLSSHGEWPDPEVANRQAEDQRNNSNTNGGPEDEPNMPTILQSVLDHSIREGKSSAEIASSLSQMVAGFCATYNATFTKDVVAKQVADILGKQTGEQTNGTEGSSKARETPVAKEERKRSVAKLKTLDMKDNDVPKGKSFFLVRTLMKQLLTTEIGCHMPWLQIPSAAKNRVEAEIRMSFKNGTYLSAAWLKKQMQAIMNHQRSYRRRLMRAYLREVEPSKKPCRPNAILKDFWDYHLAIEIARNAWLGLHLAQKDLAKAEWLVKKGELIADHESISQIKQEIAEWTERVALAGDCPTELQIALKRAEKRGCVITNTVGQGGQAIFREKYYMIFKKDPSTTECRLAEKLGQKAAIQKLEADARGKMEGGSNDESVDANSKEAEESCDGDASGSSDATTEEDTDNQEEEGEEEEEETPRKRKKHPNPTLAKLHKLTAKKKKKNAARRTSTTPAKSKKVDPTTSSKSKKRNSTIALMRQSPRKKKK